MDSDFAKINNLTEELAKYKEQFNILLEDFSRKE